MPDEDATLADFVDDGDDPDDGEDTAPDEPSPDDASPDERSADEAGPAESSPGDVGPAAPTATWEPDAVCERCGASAPRRWRDGDALVCPDCMDW